MKPTSGGHAPEVPVQIGKEVSISSSLSAKRGCWKLKGYDGLELYYSPRRPIWTMMIRCRAHLLGLLLVLVPGATRGEDGWSLLKLGMTPGETAALIGLPILRTRGHGFETWTYDNGAEAVLFGSLVAWTSAGPANLTERSYDIWREKGSGAYFLTFHSVLPAEGFRRLESRQDGATATAPRDSFRLPRFVRNS